MIYVVETFQLTERARTDPNFLEWLNHFNNLILIENNAIQSIQAFTAYTGEYELEIWFGMQNFAAIDLSEQAERDMFANAKIMEEFETFTEYLLPVGRKIMRAVG